MSGSQTPFFSESTALAIKRSSQCSPGPALGENKDEPAGTFLASFLETAPDRTSVLVRK